MVRPPHSHFDDVPGTIILFEDAESGTHHARRGDVVLQPQPSIDQEDPLNWSRFRKTRAIATVYLYVFAIGICTAVQYSVLSDISEAQYVTIGQLNLGTGLMFLFLGWGCLIWQPIAMTYGRRGVYIASILLAIAPTIWTPFSHGPGQWYAHRIILGIVASPVESLPEVSVPDLFFAHERGNYMAFYAFMLFGSNFLAPLFAGFINDAAGWHWVMYFAAILLAVCAVVIFLFMEETIYFRSTTEGVDVVQEKRDETEIQTIESRTPTKTRSQKLALVTKLSGRPTKKQMFLKSWRSVKILLFFPNIVWAGLLYGTNLAWYNVINGTMSMILGSHPYSFSPAMVGVAYLSPFLAGAVASLWAGRFADWVALRLARKNGGIREPEHRLWGLALSALLASGGLLMWGVGASQGAQFMVLIIGIGLVTFGVVCGGAISLAYSVDCFKEMTGESLVTMMLIRNTLGFAFSYAITPWIENMGMRNCFISVAGISLVCTCTFLLMVLWGKAFRKASASRYWRYVLDE
ncbi:unnamed protein product [Clonostachys chloroleuca]|uniref:Major facilitator superfamily (MFS) profile domain-containing protein n=1 Tax=Clonostachys chloroleuca TaxID=1926264 RepID=A0AA35Q7D2_9HYPO|nr:unnamed protein product [Clonostachys chloroleuca]